MCSHRWLKKGTVVTRWKDGEPISMVVPPLKHKCCQKRVVYYAIPTVSGSTRVIRRLLILAGDVEINPGPGCHSCRDYVVYLCCLSLYRDW